MKTKLFIISLFFIASFFYSCGDDDPYYPPPISCFSTDYAEYAIGEEIWFQNCSNHARAYLWDFGDGYQSEVIDPRYYYTQPGLYQVTLTAYGFNNDMHTSNLTIRIVAPPTDLSIRVMYYGSVDPVADCSVRLYGSDYDFANETNILAEGFTNGYGDIVFTDLNPVEYFIDAYKAANNGIGYFCNWNLGYITDPLEPYVVNYYDIFVEYSEGKKKKKALKIRKIVPRQSPRPDMVVIPEKIGVK